MSDWGPWRATPQLRWVKVDPQRRGHSRMLEQLWTRERAVDGVRTFEHEWREVETVG